MSVTSAFVLFAVIWFLTFLIVIPFKIKTQGDMGVVLKGTQAGASVEAQDLSVHWSQIDLPAFHWFEKLVDSETE